MTSGASILAFEPCRVCNGDARASVACPSCRGAGVSLPGQPDGALVWLAPVDDFSFTFRRLRHRINTVIHLVTAAGVLMCFGFFLYAVFIQGHATDLSTLAFWFRGQPSITAFWFGLFLSCFLIFRLRVYSDQTKVLPNWGRETHYALPITHSNRAFDVSPYFQPAAWQLLERAYGLAKTVGLTEVGAVHLFAAAFTTSAGGIFMTRLGMEFDKIKTGISALLRQGAPGSPPILSLEAKKILLAAYVDARTNRRRFVGPIELFLAAFSADPALQDLMDAAGFPPTHVRHVAEWIRIQEQLKEERDRFVLLASLKPNTAMNRSMTAQQTPLLNQFSEDLTLLARNGYIAPITGREKEMDELLRAIESGRQSVVLVGETGVGKNALIESLARRMVEENVPKELFDRRLVSVNLAQLVAGGNSGQAAERLLDMLAEVAMGGNVILVLKGIEALVSDAGGPMDLAETLATELDKGYFIAVATSTPYAWTAYLERRSLGAKLVRVNVPAMEPDDAMHVLMAKSGSIEYQNKIFFSYAALEQCVQLAARYLHDQFLPESALAIAREAAVVARKMRGEHGFVLSEDVAKVIHDKTNVPVEAVTTDESQKLLGLEDQLHARVIGQSEAVTAVAQAMRRARAGQREGHRPIANFLFLGPTGVGKTELAKALAADYFGNESAMIRLDMSEYQDPSSIARVIGAPGDQRGGLLSEAVRKTPFTIVLLDELEKAHQDILTLFLQVMDDGRLTDGVGRVIDFTNVVLIATSNAGTQFIQDQVTAGAPLEQIKTGLLERELKGIFRPEFLNRFDGVIVFKPLTLDDVTQIAWLMINAIGKRLETTQSIAFHADDAAVEELARQGFDPIFGARPLRRVIQEKVDNALADIMLRKQVARRDTIVLEAGGRLRVEKSGQPVHQK